MKLLLYSPTFYPTLGGLEKCALLLSREFIRRGHQVTVATNSAADVSVPDHDLLAGGCVSRRPSTFRLFQLGRRSDVVLVNGGLALRAFPALLCARRPYVVVHQMAVTGLKRVGGIGAEISNRLRLWMLRAAAANVGVSAAVAGVFRDLAKCAVIYNPLDPELLAIAGRGQTGQISFDLLYVGRLIRSKGIYQLAEAAAILQKRGMPARVCFCGAGDEAAGLRAFVRAKRLDPSATFLGPRYGSELAAAYQASRALVLVPHGHVEGCPLVIPEALVFGKPVIGCDQPAVSEIAGDAGIIVPEGDAAALASAAQTLLGSDVLYQRLSAAALARASLFDAGRIAERYLELFASLLRSEVQRPPPRTLSA